MGLDPWTLWSLILLIAALLAGVMLFAWWLTPRETALAYWSVAFVLLGLGMLGGVLREHLPAFAAIQLANAAILLAYALLWAGMRCFAGRRVSSLAVLAAPVLWIALTLVPPFRDSVAMRIALLSGVACVFIGLTMFELWSSPTRHLRTRKILFAMLAMMWVLNAARIPFASSMTIGGKLAVFSDARLAWFGLSGIAITLFLSFALIILVRERQEMLYRSASLIDELTGLLNRRGFLQQAAMAFPRSGPVAVMMLDLDRFKQINDQYGHAFGDRVLALFAKVLRDNLRQSDVAARLGGEEFGILLPGTKLTDAGRIAETIRRGFAEVTLAMVPDGLPQGVRGSVSIGLSLAELADAGPQPRPASSTMLDAMVRQADEALYRAKMNGRDRTEFAVFDPTRVNPAA